MNLEVKYDKRITDYIIVRSLCDEYNTFYNSNGFFYTYKPADVIHNSVVVPHIDQLTSNDLKAIKETKKINDGKEIYDYKLEFNPKKPSNFETLKQQIENKEQDLLKIINQVLPELKIDSIDLTIYISSYGTTASFYNNQVDNNIIIILRNDAPLTEIIFGIINIFFSRYYGNPQKDNSLYLWQEKQLIIDFLIKHTKIAEIFTSLNSNVYNNRLAIPDVEQATIHNKIKNAYNLNTNTLLNFSIKNIIMHGERQIINISNTESKLLSALIKEQGKVLTFDELAELIWNDSADEKYSLQAINKHIQRLRKILVENGINRQVIFTVRNQGYIFID